MRIGVSIRNMGEQSTAAMMRACALGAEERGFESIWITDHIAIPPDDAEGSGGRYVDPLITLSWLAGQTQTINLGVGVLILPYRPALPTAKQVAALQELSEGRLLLGVGIGWMDPEFRALGLSRHDRGRTSDQTLAFIRDCFANEVVEANGQPFLFKPRPPQPPLLVGGAAPHALERAARYGDGWLPMGVKPEKIPGHREDYARRCDAHQRPTGTISVMAGVPVQDQDAAVERLSAYAGVEVERMIVGMRYSTVDEYLAQLDLLSGARVKAGL